MFLSHGRTIRASENSHVPKMPPGLNSMTRSSTTEYASMRYVAKERVNSGRADRKVAPMIEPVNEPVPPIMTSVRNSAE